MGNSLEESLKKMLVLGIFLKEITFWGISVRNPSRKFPFGGNPILRRIHLWGNSPFGESPFEGKSPFGKYFILWEIPFRGNMDPDSHTNLPCFIRPGHPSIHLFFIPFISCLHALRACGQLAAQGPTGRLYFNTFYYRILS